VAARLLGRHCNLFFAAPCIWWGALVTFAEIREWWRARRSKSESGAETADYSNVIGFRIPKDRE